VIPTGRKKGKSGRGRADEPMEEEEEEDEEEIMKRYGRKKEIKTQRRFK
jgi:hypothetical protein